MLTARTRLMAVWRSIFLLIAPQLLQIIFERNMEHRTIPPMLFMLHDFALSRMSSSSASFNSGMSEIIQDKFIKQSAAMFDLLDRNIHSTLRAGETASHKSPPQL